MPKKEKKKPEDWLRFRFLTSFNINSGGPSRSNSLKKLQESAVEIIFLK
jgi:hypothetical protein